MNRSELVNQIKTKRSFLCVGLDTDLKKVPQHILNEEDPIFAFNKAIIDATAPYCVSYKPNLAFYEAYGVKGLVAFEKTVDYLKKNQVKLIYPAHCVSLKAKCDMMAHLPIKEVGVGMKISIPSVLTH